VNLRRNSFFVEYPELKVSTRPMSVCEIAQFSFDFSLKIGQDMAKHNKVLWGLVTYVTIAGLLLTAYYF
jgi:hypothetical protein